MAISAPNPRAQKEIEHAPDIPRRIRVPFSQALGMLLFLTLPVVALLGRLDSAAQESRARNQELELRVQAPTRLSFRGNGNLRIWVRNDSRRSLDRVVVRIAAPYIEAFSQVQFIPAPSRAYELELLSISPGETRLIATALQGERYGRLAGQIEAETSSSRLAVALETFVFP
jgi:hypothetical protein